MLNLLKTLFVGGFFVNFIYAQNANPHFHPTASNIDHQRLKSDDNNIYDRDFFVISREEELVLKARKFVPATQDFSIEDISWANEQNIEFLEKENVIKCFVENIEKTPHLRAQFKNQIIAGIPVIVDKMFVSIKKIADFCKQAQHIKFIKMQKLFLCIYWLKKYMEYVFDWRLLAYMHILLTKNPNQDFNRVLINILKSDSNYKLFSENLE